MENRLLKICVCVLMACILVGAVWVWVRDSAHDRETLRLRNVIAERDSTIETHKDMYERLAMETDDVRDLLRKAQDSLGTHADEISRLNDELKKSKEKLLTANVAILKWKKAYEDAAAANQTDVPGDGGLVRKKVEFEKDFGYIGVKGWTLTDPPEAWVSVSQNRPLRLSLTVSQDKAGSWHTRVASSEENVGVDIALAAVNPYVLKRSWYEDIGLSADIGGGTTTDGFGVLAGIGASYRLGKFTVGPHAWFVISKDADRFFGVQSTWHPFSR